MNINMSTNVIWAFARCIKVIVTDLGVTKSRMGGFVPRKRAGRTPWILAAFLPGGKMASKSMAI
jgi:hypothetical protein